MPPHKILTTLVIALVAWPAVATAAAPTDGSPTAATKEVSKVENNLTLEPLAPLVLDPRRQGTARFSVPKTTHYGAPARKLADVIRQVAGAQTAYRER